jgi:excisionase family DNA binding protein
MADMKEWYTVDEAAEYLGVSRRTIYKMTKEGRLHTYLLSKERTRRIRKEDLDKVPCLLENEVEKQTKQVLTSLSAVTDPALADLWDNEKDSAYDSL